jgi:integrase
MYCCEVPFRELYKPTRRLPSASETLMDRLGVPLKVRQQRLGHSDPRLTLGVYTHVASEDDEKIANQLGRILYPFGPTEKGKGLARIEQALVN